jgi:hypothetical protein
MDSLELIEQTAHDCAGRTIEVLIDHQGLHAHCYDANSHYLGMVAIYFDGAVKWEQRED